MENSKFLRENCMKLLHVILLVIVLVSVSGCSHYSDITGRVVDGVTGRPIIGAVVVAQWTNTRGILGLQYHNLHKIVETMTDNEGKFSLNGTSGFILNPPVMIIYKEGYVPWRNDMVFPSCNIVKNNEWKASMTYKLDVFTNKYATEQLSQFMNAAIIGLSDVPIFKKIYYKIDEIAINELRVRKASDKNSNN
jgi:hypothetical protein